MKQIIVSIAIIVALIAIFVIIDSKEFSRHDDVQTVQNEIHMANRKPLVSVPETMSTTEWNPAAEPKPEPLAITDSPSALPVLSPEEAMIANAEALSASAKKPASVRQQKDLHDLDFSKDVVDILLYFIPLSILLYFLFLTKAFRKLRIRRKDSSQNIQYSYWPLFLLLIVVIAQWINVFCNKNENDYDSVYYEKKAITKNDEWSKVNDKLSQVQICHGKIAAPAVFVDEIALQELPLSNLKKMTQESELQFPYFSRSGGYIVVPNTYTEKNICVYLERQVFDTVKKMFSIRGCLKICFGIIVFWLCVQLYINRSFSVIAKKAFRQKSLLVCLMSFSVILAGAFWMSDIPLTITPDGKTYIYLALSNTITKCLYGVRTPGYPLFLSVINLISPVSFHSTIYFQTLIYFLSLSWLLYELYKQGVPMILLWVAYFLFYDYLSCYFFMTQCETLEISSIAATAAIGLRLSDAVIKKRTAKFIVLLVLTIVMVFNSMMIKPFPVLILLPGCLMFLGLLGAVKFRKAFVLTMFVGILSVLLPASYCTIRWKMCGDWNFCSLINATCGAYQLTVSTPQSLEAETVCKEQRTLAKDIIHYFEQKRPDIGEWPWCNMESSLSYMQEIRMQLLYHRGIYSFFEEEWRGLDQKQRDKYKTYEVYTNARCKDILKLGDQKIMNNMNEEYKKKTRTLYSTDLLWVSDTLRKYNPYQSARYFHLTVSLPLLTILLIAFIPACKRVRYGSWKTVVILIGFSIIPLFTSWGQKLYLGAPIFEGRSEMVMFFSAMLGTILLSIYCIYSCIISVILAMRLLFLRFAPNQLKQFLSALGRRQKLSSIKS